MSQLREVQQSLMITSENRKLFTDVNQALNSNSENKNLFQCWQLNCLRAYHEKSDRDEKDEQQMYQKWENRFYEQTYQ